MVNGIGSVKLNRLIGRFKIASKIFKAEKKELLAVDGIGREIAGGIAEFDESRLKKETAACGEMGVRIVTLYDDEYPGILKTIYDPPPVLYMAGIPFPKNRLNIAMVGTRQMTDYGVAVTRKLVAEMAGSKIPFGVISGMARGVDTEAHKNAVSNGIYTAAVLGFGMKSIFPFERHHAAGIISKHGTLISEFPLDAAGSKQSFPRRNRIISGLSNGVIVIEAGEKSGTLITADCALEQGREVFAVPGNIVTLKSRGANRLIAQGAKPVQSISDIIEEFEKEIAEIKECGEEKPSCEKKKQEKMHAAGIKELPPLSGEEKKIYETLKNGEMHIDTLALESGFDIIKLSSVLTIMELKGIVLQLKGKKFEIIPQISA